MESLIEFLYHASVAFGLFFSIYWIFLRTTTHFIANRWFLLGSLICSVLIAAFPFRYQVMVAMPQNQPMADFSGTFHYSKAFDNEEALSGGISLSTILAIVYITGCVFFFMRLLFQSIRPLRIIVSKKPICINGHMVYNSEYYAMPFSFFNQIIINTKNFKQEELHEILVHEQVHIRERHWVDLLIIELLTAFFWFNPFIWMFEHAMKQNHEYLADKGVLTRGHSPVRYQALLVNQLMGMQVIGLTNNLNFALGPTRLKMMTKEKTSKKKLLRMTLGIPILVFLLYAFAKPDYVTIETANPNQKVEIGEATGQNILLKGSVKDTNGKSINGATVSVDNSDYSTTSNKNGDFAMKVPKIGTIALTASLDGFETVENSVDISDDESTFAYGFVMKPTEKGETASEKGKVTFKGKVADETGDPLPGASVVVGGTTNGTLTNKDGNFSLEVDDANRINIFISFVGYKTENLQLTYKKDYLWDVKMKRAVIAIDSKSMFIGEDLPIPPPPPVPTNESSVNTEEEVFVIVEDMPQYHDGFYGMGKYVKQKEKELQEKAFFNGKKITGKATVGFTVNAKGEVTNIQLLSKTTDEAAKALTTIISNLGRWKPGSQRGKNVSVDYAMTYEF